MTNIELIEADLKSIHDARGCLNSVKSINKDPDSSRDFDDVWRALTLLARRLQRKLDRLKNEGGAR